jgi:hypothetical protein
MRPLEAEQEREARRRLARKMAIAYLVVVPIAIAVNLIFSQFYRTPLSAVIGALVCTVGLIRILAYGERSLGLILAMVAFVLAWIVVVRRSYCANAARQRCGVRIDATATVTDIQ